jgi:predicted MFS family arabinose efflux permease
MFGAFSLFWTVAPLWLASPAFGLTQKGIALFALAGVAGAIASPIAGRVADQGLSHGATIIFMGLGAASFGLTFIAPPGSTLALGLVTAAAILLDFGVSGNLVLGQRAVYGLSAPLRGRLNGLYIATFFCGGAAGSALGGWSFAHWGWNATAGIGMAMPILGLLYFATERRLRTVSG